MSQGLGCPALTPNLGRWRAADTAAPLHTTPPHKTHAKPFEETDQTPSAPRIPIPLFHQQNSQLLCLLLSFWLLTSSNYRALLVLASLILLFRAPPFSRDFDCPPSCPSDWPFRKGVPPNSLLPDLTRLPGCSGPLNTRIPKPHRLGLAEGRIILLEPLLFKLRCIVLDIRAIGSNKYIGISDLESASRDLYISKITPTTTDRIAVGISKLSFDTPCAAQLTPPGNS